jgi:hypothetical protein
LLFSAKELVAIDATKLGATDAQAACGFTDGVGGLSRLAAGRVRRAHIKLEPLLSRVGLTLDEIDDADQRIDARKQIAFLEIVAKTLNDEFLGFSLAEKFDCRELGLLYYVMASSDTLGSALKRASPL